MILTYFRVQQVWSVHVEKSLVLIHPDLDSPGSVDAVGVLVPWEAVGVEGAEDVPDPAAGDRLQHSPALPDPEGHLEILSPPDIHLLIITPQVPERLPGHSK